MIRVIVVDDSAFMRKMITDMLEANANISVIAKAKNGKEAVEKVKQFDPDVITMDVEMPIMSGIDALKQIMISHPKPVIMVSGITKAGTEATMKAMEYGAFDFIVKPSGAISLDIHKVEKDLIDKVIYASSVSVEKLKDQRGISGDPHPINKDKPLVFESRFNNNKVRITTIVSIGTSTGGPKALQQVLTKLPENFSYPILVVQHMPKGFTKSLSERLNSLSSILVKEAEDGEVIKNGVAYIAPGGSHLKVKRIGTSIMIQLDQTELINGHRPSVDAMFTALSTINLESVIVVVMTGMGTDGKRGLIHLKETVKTFAIAESQETSVIFGMPRAAIETNYIDKVVNVEDIASVIVKYC